MRKAPSFAIGIVASMSAALSAASTQPVTTTASAPASRPVRLFDEAMVQRAEAVTSLREDPDHRRQENDRRRLVRIRLQGEDDAEARISLALGWANWELAETIAPTATRWMMGYRTRQDLRRFGRSAKWADEALDAAKRDLDALGSATDTAVARRQARRRETLSTLRLFAAACDALAHAAPASKAKVPAAQEACREAALGLAELREHEDADTAAAARLWQAALLEAGGRTRRDLAILDLALAPPERLPYDFFGRVLRCQILMDRGSHALAVALILRMEERCARWFGEDSKVASHAKLTLTAVRVNCLWHWADALEPSDPAEAARQRQKADTLAATVFPSGEKTAIYRLDRAIPIFADLPPIEEPVTTTRKLAATTTAAAPTTAP